LLNVLLIGAGGIFVTSNDTSISITDIIILLLSFSVIALVTVFIFIRGQYKEPESQTMHTLVAISLKFLMELILALLWFIVVKKTLMPSVLLFFVLYLTLTLFTAYVILKALKNKSL
jgi:hypothetical protein